ncbi:MAG: DUF2141 domain-containing protein [Chitinophagaceae bacterium]
MQNFPFGSSEPPIMEVDISGEAISGSTIHIALYRPEDKFPSEQTAFRTATIKAEGNITNVKFEVPYGDYALAVFQDENANGKLDKTAIGFPKEPFGFSNNFRPKLSKPKFRNCSFTFSEQSVKTVIKLR